MWGYGLFYLLKAKSTVVGYLLPKPFLWKNSCSTTYLISGVGKEIPTFPKSISPKMNVIARLEFELAYFKATVIVISSTFRLICPPAFFRCLSNSGTFTKLRTTSFIESTRIPWGSLMAYSKILILVGITPSAGMQSTYSKLHRPSGLCYIVSVIEILAIQR